MLPNNVILGDNMKKILLTLLFLLIISCGIGSVCASSNTTNADHGIIQNDAPSIIGNSTVDNITLNTTATQISTPDNVTSQNDGNNTGADTNTTNNTTKIPKLDIKGPKVNNDFKNIKAPKVTLKFKSMDNAVNYYNRIFQKLPHGNCDDMYEKFDVASRLLLTIYKDFDEKDTKKIALGVFAKNNISMTAEDINFCFDGIFGRDNSYRYTDYNGYFYSYKSYGFIDFFDKYFDQRKLIESDKIVLSPSVYDKYNNYFRSSEYPDTYKFILYVYKDNSKEMTEKIVTKIYNDYFYNELGYLHETGDIAKMMKEMSNGNLGGDYYKAITYIEISKLPLPARIISAPALGLVYGYTELMGFLLGKS